MENGCSRLVCSTAGPDLFSLEKEGGNRAKIISLLLENMNRALVSLHNLSFTGVDTARAEIKGGGQAGESVKMF